MSSYSTSEFKAGLKVILDNDPCSILENEFVKPGKGQAFNRVKFRNLKTGRVIERTFKSGDKLTAADVLEVEMQYLYQDGHVWHFMNQVNFEQYEIDQHVMIDASKWLSEQDICLVTLWDNIPLQVLPPNFVQLQISDTDPGLKGDTSGGGVKPATLITGAVVKVPLFVQQGEIIKIDTRTGDYISRVKQ